LLLGSKKDDRYGMLVSVSGPAVAGAVSSNDAATAARPVVANTCRLGLPWVLWPVASGEDPTEGVCGALVVPPGEIDETDDDDDDNDEDDNDEGGERKE
jgi:hypothetical protein